MWQSSAPLYLRYPQCYSLLKVPPQLSTVFPRRCTGNRPHRCCSRGWGKATPPPSRCCMGDRHTASALSSCIIQLPHHRTGTPGIQAGKEVSLAPEYCVLPEQYPGVCKCMCSTQRGSHGRRRASQGLSGREKDGRLLLLVFLPSSMSPSFPPTLPPSLSPSLLPLLLPSLSTACNGNLRVVKWYWEGPPLPYISRKPERAMNSLMRTRNCRQYDYTTREKVLKTRLMKSAVSQRNVCKLAILNISMGSSSDFLITSVKYIQCHACAACIQTRSARNVG